MSEISASTKEKLEFTPDMFMNNTDIIDGHNDFKRITFTVKDKSKVIYDDNGEKIPEEFLPENLEASVDLLVYDSEDHIIINSSDYFDSNGEVKEEYKNSEKIYFVKEGQ